MAEFKNLISLVKVEDGAPGIPGAPGERGESSDKFRIVTNQEEILKFYERDQQEQVSKRISPNELEIYVYKTDLSQSSGEILVPFQSDSIELSVFDYSLQSWTKIAPLSRADFGIEEEDQYWNYIYRELSEEDLEKLTDPNRDFEAFYYKQIVKIDQDKDIEIIVGQSWKKFVSFEEDFPEGETGEITFYKREESKIELDENLFFSYDVENNKKVLSFAQLEALQSSLREPRGDEPQNALNARLESISDWLLAIDGLFQKQSILSIFLQKIEGENTYLANRYINVKNDVSDSLAQLSLEANGIFQSIQSTALEFTANGLEVKNGGLSVSNKKGETVFEFDDKSQNLVVKGTVYAYDGSFSGEVEANSGKIGGFKIEEGILKSTDDNENILLDGEAGSIKANNLTIGDNASITGSIKIGDNVIIQNDQKFLKVSDGEKDTVVFNQDGTLKLGDKILLSGSQEKISGENWSIGSNLANFNNVNITGKLTAATFEYGETTAVGGSLFVRPSAKIHQVIGDSVYFEDSQKDSFKVADWCLIEYSGIKKYLEVKQVSEDGKSLSFGSELSQEMVGKPVINLGVPDESVGIGINGSNNDSFLTSQAISVVVPRLNENNDATPIELVPKVILGKLPSEGYGPASGSYGLYAENAVLNGQLTTSGWNKNCGIGAISHELAVDVPSDIALQCFPNKNTGKILLWAGANLNDSAASAPFFVDEYGNMYAGSGYFDGTIITKAMIEASEIKTATLTGTGENSEAALIIEDVTNGIVFKKSLENGEKTNCFKLSKDQLETTLNTVINNKLKVASSIEAASFITKGGINIQQDQIAREDAILTIGSAINEGIATPSGFNFSFESNPAFCIEEKSLSIWGDVQYKNANKEVVYEYKKALDDNDNIVGCDIFVYDIGGEKE